MEQKEKTSLDGYNDGYRLNLYSPHLFEKLKDSLNKENEYDAAFIQGAQEADKQRERERLKQLEELREPEKQTQEKEENLER